MWGKGGEVKGEGREYVGKGGEIKGEGREYVWKGGEIKWEGQGPVKGRGREKIQNFVIIYSTYMSVIL